MRRTTSLASIMLLGILSGVSFGYGIKKGIDSYVLKNSARNAVYAKAEEITPEIHQEAHYAALDAGNLELYLSIVSLSAGSIGASAVIKKGVGFFE
jgi:hypothetical protein